MPEQAKKTLVLSIYFALAVSTLLVFWQVRNFDFVGYDDNLYISENQHVLNGLTADGIIWAFTTGCATNWHPITWLSLMLDCQLFGTNPGWMHFINLLLHLVNTLLLFAVLKKMTGSFWPSAFVAAAFALHPMHVESVAWIAERKDVLSTLFWMLTLLAYVSYVKRPAAFRYLVTITIFAIGLLTKPMLVTLPFVLLLLDYWPLNRLMPQTAAVSDRRQRKPAPINDRRTIMYRIIIEKIPFLALAAISSAVTFLVQRVGGAVASIDTFPLNSRISNAFLSYATYIGKMFWPQDLAVFYPLKAAGSIPFWQVVMCAMLLFVISVFVLYLGRNQRYLPLGWFWFLGMLVPVIGIIQVGMQSLADRYTYIPYIGLFIMIAWGLPELVAKWPYRKIILGIAAATVLTAMGIGTYRQVSYWKKSFTLFTHAIEVTQNNYIAYDTLGLAYGKLGRCQDAIDAHKQAIRIKPDYAKAHYNLGNAYLKLDRHQDAIESFKQAIRIEPDYAEAHYNLGVAYAILGRYEDAIESFKQAIRVKPDYAEAHSNLGAACHRLGRYKDAIESFKQAIRIKPDYADAHNNLGLTYSITGDKESALEEYKILKTLDAERANKLFNLIGAK